VPSQQLQGQLQTQHNVDIGNSIKDKHKIRTTATEFNSILIYLCANLTAHRPITKSAQVKKKKKIHIKRKYKKQGN
jgi:hypothetical protein